MKQIVHFAIILLLLASSLASQPTLQMLEEAYKSKPDSMARDIFEKWHQATRTITQEEYATLNDTIKAVYDIYTDFFRPFDFTYIKDRVPVNDTIRRKNVPYLVVRTSIDYKIMGEGVRPLLYDSIVDFSPRIEIDGYKILTADQECQKVFSEFVGSARKADRSAKNQQERERRIAFLEQYIFIYRMHWTDDITIYTHPVVTLIIFKPDMKHAEVELFKLGHGWGVAFYEKPGNKWILKQAAMMLTE